MEADAGLTERWPLNGEQRQAVEHTEGPLLIIAGPGSGKTRVLAYRIAHILKRRLTSPQGIFAVTFTRKAAQQMRSRVGELVGEVNVDDMTITTIHSLAFSILRAEVDVLGLSSRRLRVCPPVTCGRLVRQAMEQVGLGSPWNPDVVREQIERAKDRLAGPEDFVVCPGDFFEEGVARVYARYQMLLREGNMVDFPDLVRLAVQVLEMQEEVRLFYQEMCRYLLVDEFQDTSYGQYRLITTLSARHRNLCVIGDPLQSIYRWRGADPDNLLRRFGNDWPGVRKIALTKSYRSTRTILAASEAVVQAMGLPPRGLEAQGGEGDPIVLMPCDSERDEALRVAGEIRRLVETGQAQYHDCAVLVRTGRQRRVVEQAFLRQGLPYRLVGDRPFFRRSEVQTVLGYLRLAADPFDDGALSRVANTPPRGLGPRALEKLGDTDSPLTLGLAAGRKRDDLPPHLRRAAGEMLAVVNDLTLAAQSRPLLSLFDYILERSGYLAWLRRNRWDEEGEGGDGLTELLGDDPAEESIIELRRLALQYDDVEAFLVDMEGRADDLAVEEDGVHVATLHAVKGLEFPVVFLAGLEEGLFPRANGDARSLREEYHLFYVGVTRAQRRLYLSCARYREVFGQTRETTPSRFIRCLPGELLERR